MRTAAVLGVIWVRQEGIMSLEQAVKRLNFENAWVLGIYDRGLLRPGMTPDVTIFDPDTINPLIWCMIFPPARGA
jgi:N-acyl-D-amino-acid deacylase